MLKTSNTKKIIQEFAPKISAYDDAERKDILAAVRWACGLHKNQKRASGEPFIIHPLQVAEMLIDMRLDATTITAAILHDILEDTGVTISELKREFGKEVASLVNGVTKISILRAKTRKVQEAETIRKMLFAMVKDIRVILIKLVDKLHNMRTLEYLPAQKRKRIAAECLDIYSPLAGQLGIGWLKNELEDLAFKCIKPMVYNQIKGWIAQRKVMRDDYLARARKDIKNAAKQVKTKVEIQARAKHFYSIYKKMKKRGKPIDEIFDLFGLRVICNTTGECYELLGIVHNLWIPIEGRFKDYIAMPKPNRYQSLHTTVMGYEGNLIEIQIRTREMHQTAENGIAAHWLYKKGMPGNRNQPQDLSIINKLKSWDETNVASSEFLEKIKSEILKSSLYVFTPKGDVIELPRGSTAIDFAYHIHTEVGNHCLAAKADGVIIPLRRELKHTQVIEIITSNTAQPHVNWLRFVKTAKARSKIRHWLNQHDANLIIQRNIVAKKKLETTKTTKTKETKKQDIEKSVLDKSRVGIKIGNERNMMIKIARCCNPYVGDAIIGYISRGRGIIVHKADCSNLKYIKDFAQRKIDVQWETVSPLTIKRFKLVSKISTDLFSEIEGALRKYKGHLIEGKLEENDHDTLTGFFTVELENKGDFHRVIKSIRTIPSIINVQAVVHFD